MIFVVMSVLAVSAMLVIKAHEQEEKRRRALIPVRTKTDIKRPVR